MGRESVVIRDSIRKLAGVDRLHITPFFVGEVTAVDEDNRTCEVTGILDGESIEYSGVNLSPERNDGLLEIPAIGSSGLFVKMPDGEKYVVKCSDIDKFICYIDSNNKFEFSSSGFVFNDGIYGGLVAVGDLVVHLNAIEQKINALISAVNTWIPAAGDGGLALKTVLSTWLASSLTQTVVGDLENPNVKH